MDSCIISLNLNCVLQLKQFYNKATKFSCRKKCYYFWWSTWLVMGHSSNLLELCVWLLWLFMHRNDNQSNVLMSQCVGLVPRILWLSWGNTGQCWKILTTSIPMWDWNKQCFECQTLRLIHYTALSNGHYCTNHSSWLYSYEPFH